MVLQVFSDNCRRQISAIEKDFIQISIKKLYNIVKRSERVIKWKSEAHIVYETLLESLFDDLADHQNLTNKLALFYKKNEQCSKRKHKKTTEKKEVKVVHLYPSKSIKNALRELFKPKPKPNKECCQKTRLISALPELLVLNFKKNTDANIKVNMTLSLDSYTLDSVELRRTYHLIGIVSTDLKSMESSDPHFTSFVRRWNKSTEEYEWFRSANNKVVVVNLIKKLRHAAVVMLFYQAE